MRFLTYHGLAPSDLADKVEKVRAAIEQDDFRSPDMKKLGVGGFYRARLDDASRLPSSCSPSTAAKRPSLPTSGTLCSGSRLAQVGEQILK